MASFKKTIEVTHGESLFIAQALEFYRDNLTEVDDPGLPYGEILAQVEVAKKIIPKFKIEYIESN